MRRARILKAADIRLGETLTLGRERGIPSASHGIRNDEIEVAVRSAGDLVEAIEVTCPCGRTTEIECLYDILETENQSEPPGPVQED